MSNLATVDRLRRLPIGVARGILENLEAELGPEAIAALGYEIDGEGQIGGFWSRPVQALPDPTGWSICVFTGEYGTGKTWTALHLFLREILAGRTARPRIICATGPSIEGTIIDGASGIRAWCPPGIPVRYLRSRGHEGELWIGDVKVLCCSADAPGQAVGANVDLDFRDDPAGWIVSCGVNGAEKAWATASRSCREPAPIIGTARAIVSTTPEGVEFLSALLMPGQRRGVLLRQLGRPEDNAGNLAPNFLSDTVADMRATRSWLAQLGESPFADVDFGPLHVDHAPAPRELCIAIDPALSSAQVSCEVGIVGGCTDERSTVYVLRDVSGVLDAGQHGWPARAWDLAEELQYQYPDTPWHFVIENNRGFNQPAALLRGEERIRRLRRGLSEHSVCDIREVKSAKDKCQRAASPAQLAKQMQVRFAYGMIVLEGQLRGLRPDGKDTDRADACVHLINDLSGLSDEKQVRRAAGEHELAAITAAQCDFAAEFNRRLAGKAPKPAPELLPVDGAPPGDARYGGPPPTVIQRAASWRHRKVF